MKLVLAGWTADRVESGIAPKRRGRRQALYYLKSRLNGHGGIILVDTRDCTGIAHNTPRMAWAMCRNEKKSAGSKDRGVRFFFGRPANLSKAPLRSRKTKTTTWCLRTSFASGHGFSRAVRSTIRGLALAAGRCRCADAKACVSIAISARLKSCPDTKLPLANRSDHCNLHDRVPCSAFCLYPRPIYNRLSLPR